MELQAKTLKARDYIVDLINAVSTRFFQAALGWTIIPRRERPLYPSFPVHRTVS